MTAPILDEVEDADGVQPDEPRARPRRAARPWFHRIVAILGLVVIFVGVLTVRSWRSDSNDKAPASAQGGTPRPMPTSAAIEATYGVRFIGVDVTSAGGMIQLRYQILDADKTQAIHDEDSAPIVIDGSGHTYADPGIPGHSHVDKNKPAGIVDYILLANARGGVKPGSTVTIKVGKLELHDVPVS